MGAALFWGLVAGSSPVLGGLIGGEAAGGSALAIVLGTVLDGIPETAVLGLSL